MDNNKMDNNIQKKTKKRFPLSFKLNLTSVLILLALLAGILMISYQVQRQRIQEEYFNVANKAAYQVFDKASPVFLDHVREAIDSEEFARIREQAVKQNNEEIIRDWMKNTTFTIDGAGETASDYAMTVWDAYDLIGMTLSDIMIQLDVSDIYHIYMKDGQACYLAYPPEGLLDLGTPIPISFTDETGAYEETGFDDIIVLARVYRDVNGTFCRAFSHIHDGDWDPDTEKWELVYGEDDDERYGLAVAEINMEYIVNESNRFLYNALYFMLLLTAACIALNIILVRRFATKPLKELSDATCRFGEDENGYDLENVIDVDIRSNDEINDLYQEIRAMQTRIVHYTHDLERLTSEKARAATEMQLAANIQGSMLKSSSTAFPGQDVFDIAASMDPAREVGGDFYDFFLVDEDHLALIIADVSGKGIPAALFMMSTMLLLKSHTEAGKTPGTILADVNDEISENNEAEMFVTVWMGILDLNSGLMKCANAGHEFPALRGNDGEFRYYKDPHGLVIGTMGGIKYREYELQMEPGNVIFVYTDGLPEAENGPKDFYGADRILQTLNSGTSATPADVLRRIINDVDSFVAGAEQFDDLTMLCLRYNGKKTQ